MNTQLRILIFATFMFIGVAQPLHAQLVADGATNTLNNTTNTIAGEVVIGTNGSFTLLILTNNALLTNSANGVIGRNDTAKSNEVRLVSPARWLMGNHLYIGSNGPFSRLLVGNGGTVANNNGYLGLFASSSNNTAVVTGPGSVWSNASALLFGFNGAGNQLVVSNGGVVRNGACDVGLNSSSSNNAAVVTGSGSLWSNALELVFGFGSAGNRLVISNGGVVRSSVGYLGNGASASNNLAVVTGSGSLWTNAAELYVGLSGAGNQLTVSGGGALRNGHSYVGANASASNNLVLVTGSGSVWSNALDLNVGAFSGNNQIMVSNGATVFAAGRGIIGPTANGNANSAVVTDAGSRWTLGSTLYVGSNSAFNRLLISNGGQVSSGGAGPSGVLGWNTAGSNNVAVVMGAGSSWNVAGSFYLGVNGTANQLVVSNGGLVASAQSFVGSNDSSSNNVATVTGPGSRWNTAGVRYFGFNSAGNRLEVNNGGVIRDGAGYMGVNSTSTNNVALVTGSGSLWTNEFDLRVGYVGSGNQLVVSNGAVVSTHEMGYIGHSTGANSNTATVTDSGSRWDIVPDLQVGNDGAFNRLAIRNGATVFTARLGIIGATTNARANAVIATDPATSWLLNSNLFVGSNGASSQLIISNGALVADSLGFIGTSSSSSNNLAAVTGSGSVWSNASELFLGNSGAGNQLLVSSGGVVQDASGSIGVNSSSSNNLAVVTGPDSLWDNGSVLYVGRSAGGNRLMVSNGAVARNVNGFVGLFPNGNNNMALVTGSGSMWSNTSGLFIGSSGAGNQLVVSNGGAVFAGFNLVVGSEASSLSNRVVVDGGTLRIRKGLFNPGPSALNISRGTNVLNNGLIDADQLVMTNTQGQFEFNGGTLITRGAFITNNALFMVGNSGGTPAVWDVRASATNHFLTVPLYLGLSSAFNQLLITNGAVLTSGFGLTGGNIGANSNTVLLSGPGSQWWLTSDLYVGYGGKGNRLILTNGAFVAAMNTIVGGESNGTNTEALITGPGSVFSNSLSGVLQIGSSGSSNSVRVEDGGLLLGNVQVGRTASSVGNLLSVTGPGSSVQVLTNTGVLSVGFDGSASRLEVSNGAAVFGYDAVIGLNAASSNNLAVVTGPSSRWLLSSNLYVGSNGALNRLVISNGARVENGFASVGGNISGSNNEVVVSGAGSVWTNRSSFHVGESGRGNRLVITNGGRVESLDAELAHNASSSNNEILVTGAGSFLRVQNTLLIGNNGDSNRMVIANGAAARDDNVHIGFLGSHNEVVVTGAGTSWTNTSGIQLGRVHGRNRLVITNSAFVFAREVFVSLDPASTNNLLLVDGGTLRVTNSTGAGALDVQRGTNVLNAGLIDVVQLRLNNPLGFFEFNGGTLRTSRTTNNNGSIFVVGNGTSAATFELLGGTHVFSNNLIIVSNASLTGYGTIIGTLTVRKGSTLTPGSSIGTLFLSNSPVLQGTTLMEISRNGSALTNDQILVAGPLSYGGLLTVTNIGPTALAAGDRFKLFDAASYAGSFPTLSLPPLGNGLDWTNKLLLDGSIEVIEQPVPKFASIQLSGTNVIITGTSGPSNTTYAVLAATNVASPLSNWVSIATNLFDSAGGFSFTNGILPGIPQRFYRLRWP